jgi:hypothetical protein
MATAVVVNLIFLGRKPIGGSNKGRNQITDVIVNRKLTVSIRNLDFYNKRNPAGAPRRDR